MDQTLLQPIKTNNNAWGSVNIDPGSNVTIPSVFTLNGGILSENNQIWSDGDYVTSTATVQVIAGSEYTKYYINDTRHTYWRNTPLNNVASITKNSATTYYSTVLAAINATLAGDTINFATGTYNIKEDIIVSKALSFVGQEGVIFKANNSSWGTAAETKHLMDVSAGTSENPVSFSDITFDSNSQSFGIQAYGNAYLTLNNVTLKNSKGAGMTVNGSTVIATNLNTNTNALGAVNVDPGYRVTAPSVFKLNSGTLSQNNQIWSDGKYVTSTTTVTVKTEGGIMSKVPESTNPIIGPNFFVWKLDVIKPTAIVSHNEDAKTITYTFSEPMQLVNQSGGAITEVTPALLGIYEVTGAGDYTNTKVGTITYTTLVGNVLTVTYTGSLVKNISTSYLVDAWGYNITDLAGNKIIPSISQIFTVAAAEVASTPIYSGGGGGGSYSSVCSAVTYGEWGTCINGVQYRNVLTQTPYSCTLTSAQELIRSQACGTAVVTPIATSTEIITPVVIKQVLGEKKYADGTLVRVKGDSKIFVYINGVKHQIRTLAELKKYAGREILNITADGSLTQVLGEKKYANGSLLRGTDKKVYILINGKLKHVRSLVELRKYAGHKINDVANTIISGYEMN